jgi:hypothetical protein
MGEVTPPARRSREAETDDTDGTPRLALVAMGLGLARTLTGNARPPKLRDDEHVQRHRAVGAELQHLA